MLSVVDPHNSGIGGGGLALIRLGDGQVHAIDGREMAPSRSHLDQYRGTDGRPNASLSQEGPLAVATPGLVALLDNLATRFGKIPWHGGLARAAEVAARGFPVGASLANSIEENATRLKRYDSTAAILLDSSGRPWRRGDLLVQSDLAETLRKISQFGRDWFYQDAFAEMAGKFISEHGGFLHADDFAQYRTVDREVVQSRYRGRSIHGFSPPSSGGIHIAQMLGMLESFDLSELFQTKPAKAYHLLIEVMKRALADRAFWLGDADFAKVPRGLVDADYLRRAAETIDLDRVTQVDSHGIPPRHDVDLFGSGGHTTHLTTADAEGNVVALTQTINTSFGSKLILPGTGVVLNNEMDDFSLAPGVRNAFGLLGSEANAVVARKRPLSSMSPTIVVDSSRRPVFTCGAAGGPRIITVTLQSLIRAIDLGMDPTQILAEPRVHHQWSPDNTVVESILPESITTELTRMGHKIQRIKHIATAQALAMRDQAINAAADPRVNGAAAAK